MKRREQQRTNGKSAEDVLPPLDDENPLKGVVGQLKPHQYARASAHEFAVGKYSNRRRRPRYAQS